jgi:hypothetical protein
VDQQSPPRLAPHAVAPGRSGSYTVMTSTTFNASNTNEDQDRRLTHTMYGS